mmetsp:Transcript_49411/g.148892  ORF Transcript_49411/g.148892 Transcript_49411/m.148892 type:complete len:114 (-) Transcript_49411:611-952(-)
MKTPRPDHDGKRYSSQNLELHTLTTFGNVEQFRILVNSEGHSCGGLKIEAHPMQNTEASVGNNEGNAKHQRKAVVGDCQEKLRCRHFSSRPFEHPNHRVLDLESHLGENSEAG